MKNKKDQLKETLISLSVVLEKLVRRNPDKYLRALLVTDKLLEICEDDLDDETLLEILEQENLFELAEIEYLRNSFKDLP